MRPFSLITTALLLACAAPLASRADTASAALSGSSTAVAAPVAACDEPGPRPQRVVRPRRHVYVHRYRRWRPVPLVVHNYPVWPAYYDAPIPAPWDPAYDRGMTLHFRSPPVSGIYIAEPGFPLTPPIHPYQPYRLQGAGRVLQYDGITGEYIPLAQPDAARILAMLPPPPAAPPAP